MSFLPFAALWLALLIAALLSAVLRSRSRLSLLLSPVLVLLAGGLWVWGRPPDAEAVAAASFLGYGWRVGTAVWQLTGMTLALLLTTSLSELVAGRPRSGPGNTGALLLGVCLLPFVWAADPRSSVLLLGLFAAVWAGVLVWSGAESRQGIAAGFALGPVLLLWFADTVALSGAASAVWLEVAGAAVVVAGAWLLGAWPLGLWRRQAAPAGVPVVAALAGLPVIAGATVLLPVAQQGSASGLQIAVAVVLGLVTLLMGLRWAGDLADGQPTGVAGLAGALVGPALLAAVFTSPNALLAAARVAVFVPVALWLAYTLPAAGASRWLRVGTVIVVWLAVMGVPLTAGFISSSSLYVQWQPGAELVLLGVLVLLLVGWSAALSAAALRLIRRAPPAEPDTTAGWLAWLPVAVPLAALAAVDATAVANASLITWVALVVPLVVGPVLAGLLDGRVDLSVIEESAVVPGGLPAAASAAVGGGRRLVSDAVAEALAILEGPGGLLWVLGMVILLLLIV